MAAILNKPRGLFHFHLATLLVGNAILAGLVLINIESTDVRSGQTHQGWPFKYIRYDGSAPDSPFLDIVNYDALAANILLWLTIFLLPVVLVESRCRNGKVADGLRYLKRFHWIAWLFAIAAAVVLNWANLLVTENQYLKYEYGWPFKFYFLRDYSQIYGIRYIVLNLYLAAFITLLILVFAQYFIRNKKDNP